jgi:uncharacterized protein YbjT (DUF2867 family)
MQTDRPTTLVLGATGKTGSRVARLLEARGFPVRHGSRSAEIPFDWADAATWPAAVAGVEQVYLSFHPDLAVPGAVAAVQHFCELAVEAGVQRIVVLSGRGEPEAQAAEKVVADAGVAWTVVRASWFSQNFSEGHLYHPVLSGTLALPAAEDAVEAFVDIDDLAEVAVVALTEPGHDGEIYEVTGPRLITFREAVAAISAASGRVFAYQAITPEAYQAALLEAQVPADFASFLTWLVGWTLDGHNAYVTDGVQRALGRPPRDFVQYVHETAKTGVWGAP